jgi:hypothetical protein
MDWFWPLAAHAQRGDQTITTMASGANGGLPVAVVWLTPGLGWFSGKWPKPGHLSPARQGEHDARGVAGRG